MLLLQSLLHLAAAAAAATAAGPPFLTGQQPSLLGQLAEPGPERPRDVGNLSLMGSTAALHPDIPSCWWREGRGGLPRQYRVMLRFRPTLLSYCSLWFELLQLLQPLLFEPLQSSISSHMSKSSIWGLCYCCLWLRVSCYCFGVVKTHPPLEAMGRQ